MKKAIVCLFVLFLSMVSFGQSLETAEGDSIPWEFRKQAFIYNTAKLFNDPQVAKMALYNLISENPSNAPLYDSLALLYLQYNQYASAALVAQQSLQVNQDNRFATEIAGSAFDNLGVKDKAIPYYETLYLADNDLSILYKIAFLQMEAGRYEEANASIKGIMENEESKNILITFPTEDRNGQEVPLNVSAHRIKGMIEEGKGNDEEAKMLYLKTLEMHPGFQIVQRQLQDLTKKGKEAK